MSYGSTNTQFIAIVYPGWHPSTSRPGLNEWDLLDQFKPYFQGHLPPPRPQDGPYDDSDLATAQKHISIASKAGIAGFTYCLYFGSEGLVLNAPLEATLNAARQDFVVSTTWCIHLPHANLPLPQSLDGASRGTPTQLIEPAEGTAPMTLRDIATFMPSAQFWDLRLESLLPFVSLPEVGDLARTYGGSGSMFEDKQEKQVLFHLEEMKKMTQNAVHISWAYTFKQIQGIMESLETLQVQQAVPLEKLTLRHIKNIFEVHKTERLPLGSFIPLVEICGRLELGKRSANEVFQSMTIMDLANISARKPGWLSPEDVVSLAKIGRKIKNQNDVLGHVQLNDLREGISEAALMTLTIGDIGRILEQLATL